MEAEMKYWAQGTDDYLDFVLPFHSVLTKVELAYD